MRRDQRSRRSGGERFLPGRDRIGIARLQRARGAGQQLASAPAARRAAARAGTARPTRHRRRTNCARPRSAARTPSSAGGTGSSTIRSTKRPAAARSNARCSAGDGDAGRSDARMPGSTSAARTTRAGTAAPSGGASRSSDRAVADHREVGVGRRRAAGDAIVDEDLQAIATALQRRERRADRGEQRMAQRADRIPPAGCPPSSSAASAPRPAAPGCSTTRTTWKATSTIGLAGVRRRAR